jgi:hypothetical protein
MGCKWGRGRGLCSACECILCESTWLYFLVTLQGGAPKGSEPPKGGRSAWGTRPFADEFHNSLTHSGMHVCVCVRLCLRMCVWQYICERM